MTNKKIYTKKNVAQNKSFRVQNKKLIQPDSKNLFSPRISKTLVLVKSRV